MKGFKEKDKKITSEKLLSVTEGKTNCRRFYEMYDAQNNMRGLSVRTGCFMRTGIKIIDTDIASCSENQR